MATGNLSIDTLPNYEDYTSFKKWARSSDSLFKTNTLKLVRFLWLQAGTGSEVELENKSGETIADIASTGETWVAQISAYAENVVVTLVWKNNAGTTTTSTVTLTDANETAFTTPITTGYAATGCSIDVVNPAGVTVKVGATGMATPVATIQAAATVALEADLSGVGRVNVAQKTDQVSTDGEMPIYIPYTTPWGELKYGYATLNDTDTSTEVALYEASSAFAATTVLVKDFYRRRTLTSETTVADEVLLVAPGGGTVYGVIPVDTMESVHSRYVCPTGRSAWLARICMNQAIATALDCYVLITYTPYGETYAHTCQLSIPNNAGISLDPLLRLAAGSEIKFVIKGNLSSNSFDFHIVEVENV
jgi:hypothetical protein